MMKVMNFFLSMIRIWVDKYNFRCNLTMGNGIKKFITISVVYYNFGCQLSIEIVITEIVIKKSYYNFGLLLQFRLPHGHHTVTFVRLIHLDCFVKIVANLCPSIISKLITVINISKQIHNHA